ncbi:MAG: hypothetical protein WCW56_01170 [Candidatus Paceibacterota bacterium]|jgi:hypothetical protein
MSTKNTSKESEVVMATGEQVEHIMDMWRRRLNSRKLTLAEAQHIIQNGGQYLPIMDKAADVLVDQVRSDTQNTIIRMVRNVQRNRSAEQAINATGRTKYVDSSVLASMPVGSGPEEVELVYFKLGRYVGNEELEREYDVRGLRPDPQAQSADNEGDPSFADDHPNGCLWGRDGRVASFVAFGRWFGGREVSVDRVDCGWFGRWWFAGVRK